ncbi:MAG: TIGR04255 family protein [Nitrospirota bacterium]|nr:TIGR04255 family protein [Nitrospirota bacterium]
MRFPDSDRVIYAKNPLETVICQLRFPPILRIDAESPFQFQEQLRATYPLFKERQFDAALSLPPEIKKVFGDDIPWAVKSGRLAYDFYSEDETWTVTLSNEFIALTSKRYSQWSDFKDRLLHAVDSLERTYQPAHFTRIGLRYRDVINRSKLNLKGVEWSALLAPHISGELGSVIGKNVQNVRKELLVELDNGMGNVRIVHGLTQRPDTDEPCYMIDSDFFVSEKMEVNSAGERLNYFNREAGRLFKWCVTPQLHNAMEPRAITPGVQPSAQS